MTLTRWVIIDADGDFLSDPPEFGAPLLMHDDYDFACEYDDEGQANDVVRILNAAAERDWPEAAAMRPPYRVQEAP